MYAKRVTSSVVIHISIYIQHFFVIGDLTTVKRQNIFLENFKTHNAKQKEISICEISQYIATVGREHFINKNMASNLQITLNSLKKFNIRSAAQGVLSTVSSKFISKFNRSLFPLFTREKLIDKVRKL